MSANPQVAVEACAQMVAASADACRTAATSPIAQSPANPNLDAVAVALASQGNAIAAQAQYLTLASIGLGIIAVIATVSWAWLVKGWATRTAQDAVNEWMRENAYTEFSKVAAEFTPKWLDGTGRDERQPLTQTDMEKGLSGDPTKDA